MNFAAVGSTETGVAGTTTGGVGAITRLSQTGFMPPMVSRTSWSTAKSDPPTRPTPISFVSSSTTTDGRPRLFHASRLTATSAHCTSLVRRVSTQAKSACNSSSASRIHIICLPCRVVTFTSAPARRPLAVAMATTFLATPRIHPRTAS